MSSKRFKEKLCAYCSEKPSVTGDHIFAREFFLGSARGNLPKAPISRECNNEKSKLEHYLTAVLPLPVGMPTPWRILHRWFHVRLQNNAKLHRQLLVRSSGRSPARWRQDGTTVPPDREGLIWHHWKVYLEKEKHSIHAATCRPNRSSPLR